MVKDSDLVLMPVAQLRDFVVACSRAMLQRADDWTPAEIVADLGEGGEWRTWLADLVKRSVEVGVEHGQIQRGPS